MKHILKKIISGIINDKFPPSASKTIKNIYYYLRGYNQQWARVVMDRETARYVASLNYKTFKALEISGSKWEKFGFAYYRSVKYPEYNLCKDMLGHEMFDIIIAEQVLEHVSSPYRAVQNLYRMLRSGGIAVITTPFLIKIHEAPLDCSRWTESGIKYLLIEGGFNSNNIKTGSWGNKTCIVANFKKFPAWIPWKHSLKNEPGFPVVVWALAQK